MLTVQQAAAELGVSPQRIRVLCAQGRLVAEKPGRDWIIEPESVAMFERRRPGRRRKGAAIA